MRCSWLLSGIFFVLFEGIFWSTGYRVFEFLTSVPDISVYWFNIVGLFFSVIFFGLFIWFAGKSVSNTVMEENF